MYKAKIPPNFNADQGCQEVAQKMDKIVVNENAPIPPPPPPKPPRPGFWRFPSAEFSDKGAHKKQDN